jgi:hypothetical protein
MQAIFLQIHSTIEKNCSLSYYFQDPVLQEITENISHIIAKVQKSLYLVRNLDNFLIILIQKFFDMTMAYTQIDNLNVTHSKHAYLNEL